METDGDKLILTFEADGDLDILDKDCYADYKTDELIESDKLDVTVLNGFEIAGEDGIYYSANAEIKGKTVILSCDEVKTPVKARYAFGAYPESPNLHRWKRFAFIHICYRIYIKKLIQNKFFRYRQSRMVLSVSLSRIYMHNKI